MRRRFQQYRDIGDATFPRHQRRLDILAILSLTMLLGIIVTGIWQFFAHESNPDWYAYEPGSNFVVSQPVPSGMAQVHGLFGLGATVVALVGTGWFAYRIAHNMPMLSLVSLICIMFASLTEAAVRFNIIKIEGKTFEEAGPGYGQLFTNDIDYVVTDVGQTGHVVLDRLAGPHRHGAHPDRLRLVVNRAGP